VNPTFRLRSLPPSSRKRVRHFIRTLLACGAVLASPGASHGQDVSVAGRVIDANGDVVASRTVVLHRVTPDGGALLAQDTTNSEGGFLLEAPAALRQDGVFFVAARHEGELYIGPLLRPPLPAPGDYVLEVGVPGRALADVGGTTRPGPPVPGSATGSSRRWLLALAPLLGLLALGVWAIARASGPPARRRLLIHLAELDNEWEAAAGQADDARYFEERRRLLERIRSTG
jgi:hypothetical protein